MIQTSFILARGANCLTQNVIRKATLLKFFSHTLASPWEMCYPITRVQDGGISLSRYISGLFYHRVLFLSRVFPGGGPVFLLSWRCYASCLRRFLRGIYTERGAAPQHPKIRQSLGKKVGVTQNQAGQLSIPPPNPCRQSSEGRVSQPRELCIERQFVRRSGL